MAEGELIRERKWSGLDNWLCVADPESCIYDSFDRTDVERHVQAAHDAEGKLVPHLPTDRDR
jgi:(2Fe-2S) ferredoxin